MGQHTAPSAPPLLPGGDFGMSRGSQAGAALPATKEGEEVKTANSCSVWQPNGPWHSKAAAALLLPKAGVDYCPNTPASFCCIWFGWALPTSTFLAIAQEPIS